MLHTVSSRLEDYIHPELTWERGSIAVDGPNGGEVVFSPLLSLVEGAFRITLGDTFLPFV